MTRTYRVALGICTPIVRLWGRLEVEGLEHIPAEGPLIVGANHDCYWDPVVVGIAAIRRRQIRALAKSSLWKVKGLNKVLDGMGQIPIVRGTRRRRRAGPRDRPSCAAGAASGSSPRARAASGARCARAAASAASSPPCRRRVVVPVAVTGTTDITRFPKRPRLHVRFLAPPAGDARGRVARRLRRAGRRGDPRRSPRSRSPGRKRAQARRASPRRRRELSSRRPRRMTR